MSKEIKLRVVQVGGYELTNDITVTHEEYERIVQRAADGRVARVEIDEIYEPLSEQEEGGSLCRHCSGHGIGARKWWAEVSDDLIIDLVTVLNEDGDEAQVLYDRTGRAGEITR